MRTQGASLFCVVVLSLADSLLTAGVGRAAAPSADSADRAAPVDRVEPSPTAEQEVADLGAATDVLMQLHPVIFQSRVAGATGDDSPFVLRYGLIADEVARVDPALVQFGDDGQPLAVRYPFVAALLLGEIQKQHATIAVQQAIIAEQAMKISGLAAAVDKQSADLSDRAAAVDRQGAEIDRQRSAITALETTVATLTEAVARLTPAAAEPAAQRGGGPPPPPPTTSAPGAGVAAQGETGAGGLGDE